MHAAAHGQCLHCSRSGRTQGIFVPFFFGSAVRFLAVLQQHRGSEANKPVAMKPLIERRTPSLVNQPLWHQASYGAAECSIQRATCDMHHVCSMEHANHKFSRQKKQEGGTSSTTIC